MTPFERLSGIAAPLPAANVDTDMILPSAFLKTVTREGLGPHLFHNIRYDAQGAPRPDFILNREPWSHAQILVALDNFGCGSSREHAAWALLEFGIRCIIAPSFADIFLGNSFRNGILPLCLPRKEVDRLLELAAAPDRARMNVDLAACTLTTAVGVIRFDLDSQRRERLLRGEDEIMASLRHADAIAAHEQQVRAERPWLAETRLRRGSAILAAAPE